MPEFKSFALVNKIFDSIIIFSYDNKVVFAGNKIKKILSNSWATIQNLHSGKVEKNIKQLKEAIGKVKNGLIKQPFELKINDEYFILFPAENNKQIILALEKDISQVNKMEHDLKERVKELECLYQISRELQIAKEIKEAFVKCTEHIKKGFQFPEITSVIIEIDGNKYKNKDGTEKNNINELQVPVLKNYKKRGKIRVIYHENLPFLKEEDKLLAEISIKFSKAIEKYEQTKNLEKQKKILISKNKELIELTEEARQSREKLQTFFRAITDKIYVIDTNFNIIQSNSDEIGNSGKCYKKIFKSNEICENCPAVLTLIKLKPASLEKEHNKQHFLLHSYPIYNKKNNIDSILEVCRDVTKEKEMESQLIESYKLASLGKVVAGVAHEINNPNTFILGNIKIIKEAFNDIYPILDEKYSQQPDLKIARLNYDIFKENIKILVEDIYNGSIRLKKIVGDLRTFARKDENLHTDTIYINDLIKNTIRLTKNQITKNINISTSLNPDIPTFNGSVSKLEQVLLNIITNASEAINKKKGEINIQTDYIEKNNLVKIMIKDNGIGMDAKTKSNIFDPFFTTKRKEGGIGLGLSISYGIINEHNGTIEVSSKLGKGTTFTICIPVK